MKTFDWKKFKLGGIAVHCDTEAKANDFLKQAHQLGFTWSGKTLLEENYYRSHENETCYEVWGGSCIKELAYQTMLYYQRNDYEILEWSDYMEFTKEDLKVGMLIKTNSGNGIVMPSSSKLVAIYESGNWSFINFGDVIKVYGYSNEPCFAMSYSSFHRDLLYERRTSTVKEMTVEEISKALGCEIKIVKG